MPIRSSKTSYGSRPLTSKLFQLTALTLALTLAGCGGGDGVDSVAPPINNGNGNAGGNTEGSGGDNGEDQTPDNSISTASNIFISSEKTQLLTGQDKTTVNIRVTDESGGIVGNVPVTIKIDDAALYGLSINGTSNQVTDDKGLVTVELIQGVGGIDSQLNHETLLTVTANGQSGTVKQVLPIRVSGTHAKDVVSSKNIVESVDSFRVSGQIVDGTVKPITNADIVLYSNGQEVGKGTTDNSGNFVFDLNAADLETTNDDYIFSIEVKGTKASQRIPDILTIASVSSLGMSFSKPDDIIVGNKQSMTLSVPSAKDNDIVYVSTNKGTLNGTTKSRLPLSVKNNEVMFDILSNVPGTATVKAEYGNDSKQTVLSFVSIEPTKLLLLVESAVVSVGGATSVIATVLDKDDAPVKNAIVQFTVTKDASAGNLSQGIAYTDSNGRATVTYNAGQNPTSTDGVVIKAEVQSVKLPDGQEKSVNTILNSSAITVQTKSTYISFAFADRISAGPRNVFYFQQGSISVLNSAGKPVANQLVSINVIPENYLKGKWSVIDNKWKQDLITCDNEDKNNNGILDDGEDVNDNGLLDPFNAAAVFNENEQQVESFVTDATGKVDFSIRYPKEYAEWYMPKITVNTKVDGSESQQSRVINLPVLVNDVNISAPTRPNMKSPFGTDLSCSSPD